MAGWTNKGKVRVLNGFFHNAGLPTNLYMALCTSAVAPNPDVNTLGNLVQIAPGNGYVAGGFRLGRNPVDFDVLTEDDTNDRGLIQVRDVVWTAVGGPIPASGAGARWAVLTDDNATVANREVIAFFDLASERTVAAGQKLTLQNCELRLNEV
jgi:hypothetical protein